MALRDRIFNFQRVATATPATLATPNAKEARTVATVATVAVARKEKTEKQATELTTEKVDWLKPCPICSGHLFTESDRGGYFCCECQTLPPGAKPARIVEGSPAVKSAVKVVMLRKRQVNCQAYEQTGVLASTSPEHCREWQGSYCTGCPLQTIH